MPAFEVGAQYEFSGSNPEGVAVKLCAKNIIMKNIKHSKWPDACGSKYIHIVRNNGKIYVNGKLDRREWDRELSHNEIKDIWLKEQELEEYLDDEEDIFKDWISY